MKKQFLLIAAILLAGTAVVNAQGGGGGNFPRRTVQERIQVVHQKIDSAFKLDAVKLAQVDSAFANYYRAQDRLREEMQAGGDRNAMREKMQPLTDARDKELKTALGDDNFKKFKDEIEPSMRRPGGGGGPGGGNRQQ
jgi:hypothetical protein